MRKPPNDWIEKKTKRQSDYVFGKINGSYVDWTRKHPVLICNCGNRYLKTRDRQKACLRCVAYSMVQ